MTQPGPSPIPCAVILGGGMALGAYQAGVLQTLVASRRIDLRAVAGSSIGAMTAALLAGNSPEAWSDRLRVFWESVAFETAFDNRFNPLADPGNGTARHVRNWMSVAAARLGGAPNFFRPRWPNEAEQQRPYPSLYQGDAMRTLLARLIDFDRLNTGPTRLCIAACDVEAGEPVLYDTQRRDAIGVDEILASGSLLPAFSPVTIDGRVLVDGGYAMNAPLEPFVASDRAGADWPLLILIDLFSPDDVPPTTLERALTRSTDLQYAMQTRMRLLALERERALEARLHPQAPGADLFHLSYRPLSDEAGPEKTFDFSRASLRDRMAEGARDADLMLTQLAASAPTGETGLRVHRIRRTPD